MRRGTQLAALGWGKAFLERKVSQLANNWMLLLYGGAGARRGWASADACGGPVVAHECDGAGMVLGLVVREYWFGLMRGWYAKGNGR